MTRLTEADYANAAKDAEFEGNVIVGTGRLDVLIAINPGYNPANRRTTFSSILDTPLSPPL
jgi:hypothetical protein